MLIPRAGSAALVLVCWALATGGVVAGESVSTEVEVANVGPVVEDHRAGPSPETGDIDVVWVWVSDLNGAEDVASVELVAGGQERSVALEAGWSSGSVARFELVVPDIAPGTVWTIVAEDAEGAQDHVIVDGLGGDPDRLERQSTELPVPVFTGYVVAALAFSGLVASRGRG